MIWGALWISKNDLGDCNYIIHKNRLPVMFLTKKECREWINKNYGYIKTRKDLKSFPHYWRLPKPIKLKITY